VSEQLLTLLRFSLLGFLYLFLFRVVRAVWAETAGRRERRRAAKAAAAPAAPAARAGRGRGRQKARALVVVAPPERAGHQVELPAEATVGRAAGCQIPLDDSFVSQLHARVFRTDDGVFVEDLGSTNGTFLNDQRVGGPQPVRRGDRIQVGQTVLELR
jgi:hypothetical protein